MSVRIYTTPGSIIFPKPVVLREYAPERVSRQVRYTRSLSTPLGFDKGFTYAPWEISRRDFTTAALLENKRKNFTSNAFDSKRRDLVNIPLGTKERELIKPLSENRRRDFINSSFQTKPQKELTAPLLETRRRDFVNRTLETKQRELLIPLSESKRRDFTKSHFLTSSYLEDKRRDLQYNHLDTSRTNCYLENKKRDNANGHLDDNKRDLSDNSLENKEKDLSSQDLETRSRTLPAAPRALRWRNRDKNLCTIDDLLEIIREPTGHYELPTDPCNEVYPGIILSDGPTALCTSMLKRMGVSHVLNAAQGKERPGQVNTSPSFYSYSGIRFLGVEAFDHIAFRLYPYFDEASDFMQDALDSGGKVLVHCRAGISRSATLVCAFLMLKKCLSVQEAIRTVRKNRAIIPNDGFLQQLCDLNERLHKTRGP